MRRYIHPILSGLIFSIFILSCSGANAPTTPDEFTRDKTPETVSNSGHVLWGMWNVIIDSTSSEAEIFPLRGVNFNANVVNFLHPPLSPVNQLQIAVLPTSDPVNGYFEVDVTLFHPFVGLNQYTGFDVRGIFMADGSKTSALDSDIVFGTSEFNEAHMIEPDGYTRWWNATEFTDPLDLLSFNDALLGNDPMPTATLNPYMYFADAMAYDGSPADLDPATRGAFTPDGPTHTRLYMIQFPVETGPVISFNYAVDASWNEPDPSFAPEYPLEAFTGSAQVQEAYHLSINTSDSTLWYEGGESGGSLDLVIEVFDWQSLVNSAGVMGELNALWVESEILPTPLNILPAATISGGSQATSSVFEVELESLSLNISAAGDFSILVTAESANPSNYQPQIDGGENFIFPDVPLAAYQFGYVTVGDTQGVTPADDVTGDVALSVDRNSSDTITGVTLDWTDNGSPYYAIYADDNPYNGLDPTIFVTEVATNSAPVTSAEWSAFSTNGAYIFSVKGRTVSGNSGSESPNFSEYAFIEMEDFDGGASPVSWDYGYADINYKWEEQSGGMIDGSTSLRCNTGIPINQWGVAACDPVPAIPDSDVAFTEFAHIASSAIWKQFSVGFTHSDPPTGTSQYLDYDTTQDFDAIMDGTYGWVPPACCPPGGGWTSLISRFGWPSTGPSNFFGWRFYDCPKGTSDMSRVEFLHFINDAGTIRPAFGWATSTFTQLGDWMELDEIAVVIY